MKNGELENERAKSNGGVESELPTSSLQQRASSSCVERRREARGKKVQKACTGCESRRVLRVECHRVD